MIKQINKLLEDKDFKFELKDKKLVNKCNNYMNLFNQIN